ncbi:hypothetical protein HMPREF9439_01525 [Parasutterella excrementihominis YIT 11859]|uniref:Uncharacterized protein n=1 Tax=Parasutterella excrementihominis YIT 11859 TaxID=762966 RepID=F3QKR4_9BURK|nr:hypothetical protein HMPREF9439_01525 [Parasutterella excrementihominis YIT 11859]
MSLLEKSQSFSLCKDFLSLPVLADSHQISLNVRLIIPNC